MCQRFVNGCARFRRIVQHQRSSTDDQRSSTDDQREINDSRNNSGLAKPLNPLAFLSIGGGGTAHGILRLVGDQTEPHPSAQTKAQERVCPVHPHVCSGQGATARPSQDKGAGGGGGRRPKLRRSPARNRASLRALTPSRTSSWRDGFVTARDLPVTARDGTITPRNSSGLVTSPHPARTRGPPPLGDS